MKFTASTPVPRSPGLPVEGSGFALPPFVHDYLAQGAAKGGRNDVLHRVAQQFLACQLPQAEAEARLIPRAVADGLGLAEARAAIRSAYRSTQVTKPLENRRAPGKGGKAAAAGTKQKAAVKNSATGSTSAKANTEAQAPGFLEALHAAFEPGESIAVVESRPNADGEWKPSHATIKTREQWVRWLERMGSIQELFGSSPGGAFIGINPLKAGSESRSNDNVASYRHVLAEWDGLPVEEQHERLVASGLPISVLVSSGGKSVHGWVRVDARDKAEWEQRRDVVHQALGCDPKNKDVARVSRCPGVLRGAVEQKVLAVKIGAPSWGDWQARESGLPGIMSVGALISAMPARPPELVKGLLFRGCKLVLGAPSKGRKSWALIDLALSVAAGWDWLGMKCAQGRVLYINLELAPWMLAERVSHLCEDRGRQLFKDAAPRLDVWNLRGHVAAFHQLVPLILDRIRTSEPYALVILDPLYKGLGDADENAAGDINRLMNHLESLCHQSGAALAIAHHFAKGDPWEKDPADRLSGSGVFARDPDALVVLTPGRLSKGEKDRREGVVASEDKGVLLWADFILRATTPLPGRWLRWQRYHFTPEDGGEKIQSFRLGSYADRYGPVLNKMPQLTKSTEPATCELLAWVRKACRCNMDVAVKIWDTLKNAKYPFVISLGQGRWMGAEGEAF